MIDLLGEQWRRALEHGLAARALVISDAVVPMPMFRIGPFAVAYAGFPVGIEREAIPEAMTVAKRDGAAVLRIIGSGNGPLSPGTAHRYLQTSIVIDALSAWSPAATEKARRTRNRRARTDVSIRTSTDADSGAVWHLYEQTIQRHRGAVRYTSEYFGQLAPDGLLVAELAGKVVGFVACGMAAGRAYYLHGAHDPEARASYPSDLLFLSMIEAAQVAGATSFDFLPSPAHQPQLNAYKRSWGGVEQLVATDDVPLNLAGRLFAAAYSARYRVSAWSARQR